MRQKAPGTLLLLLALCTSVHAVPVGSVPADNASIEYTGRIDFTNPVAPRFSYSGVSVRARFQGTAVSASLQNDGTSNIYNVIVDGVVTQRITLSNGEQTIALASGLVDSTHEFEIYKLTESTRGKTRFRGFVVDAGKMLVALTSPPVGGLLLFGLVPALGIAVDLYILVQSFFIELWAQPWATGKSVVVFDVACAALALAAVFLRKNAAPPLADETPN